MKTDKPNIIYLQDEDVNDNYEGVTWCFHKIDDNDSKYIKANYLKDMIDEMIEKAKIDTEDFLWEEDISDEFTEKILTVVRGAYDQSLTELRSKL